MTGSARNLRHLTTSALDITSDTLRQTKRFLCVVRVDRGIDRGGGGGGGGGDGGRLAA